MVTAKDFTYLVIDDEEIILEGMEMTLRDVVGKEPAIFKAQDPFVAIDIVKQNKIDIAFCDVDMPGMNGLHLADELHKINEDIELVFATGYAHYSLDAWQTTAKAFILKPVSEEELTQVLAKICRQHDREEQRHLKKVEEIKKSSLSRKGDLPKDKPKVITAMCFGNFELLYKGKPIHFARRKSKEMLAYLIDRRGAMISTAEIRMILWEEEEDTDEKAGYVRVLANDIRKAFDALGEESILIHDQDKYCVDVSRISCDYLDYLAGDENARRIFQFEYMNQFSWAEATLGRLMNM